MLSAKFFRKLWKAGGSTTGVGSNKVETNWRLWRQGKAEDWEFVPLNGIQE